MRKLLYVAMLGLSLTACAEVQKLETAFNFATKSVANPVTANDLYNIESGATIAIAVLGAYKKGCSMGTVDTNCRANVAKIQVYTRQLPPLLTQLRSFVKNNDQVNATVIYNNIVELIADFKSTATAAGINVGG